VYIDLRRSYSLGMGRYGRGLPTQDAPHAWLNSSAASPSEWIVAYRSRPFRDQRKVKTATGGVR
jgi:hypothetical protein